MSDYKETGIIFQGWEVRAIRNCKPGVWPAEPIDPSKPWKWQTRRVIRSVHPLWPTRGSCFPAARWTVLANGAGEGWAYFANDHPGMIKNLRCPYGIPGDHLWCRETYWHDEPFHADCLDSAEYAADHEPGWHPYPGQDGVFANWVKHPSICMPRWAAREVPVIKNIRVERVQEITPADAQAEGVEYALAASAGNTARDVFGPIWDSINAKRGYLWSQNTWCWVIDFMRMEAEK